MKLNGELVVLSVAVPDPLSDILTEVACTKVLPVIVTASVPHVSPVVELNVIAGSSSQSQVTIIVVTDEIQPSEFCAVKV